MSRRTLTPKLTRRTAVGLAALLLSAGVLASRVRTIAREPRVPLGPRVAQLMHNRMLALQVQAYARTYGRPAYYLDSVEAHLDSAERERVSALRTDLWGDSVTYFWSYCEFSVSSEAGVHGPNTKAAFDSTAREMARRNARTWPVSFIREEYAWPADVGRTTNCDGVR